MEAIDALKDFLDPDTRSVLEKKMSGDSNSFIRFKAKRALDRLGHTQLKDV